MPRRLTAFTHDSGLEHAPPGPHPHVEHPGRLTAARAGVEAWDGDVAWTMAHEARPEELLLAHFASHVERVREACQRGGWIDADTYATPASWPAALAAAGAAVDAARSAAAGRPAFAVARPPGHHATRERAMGFCLINNVAVAAAALAADGKRVAIVDVDVHHGNGTEDVFADRDDVLYASLHQHPLYPGTGAVEDAGRGAGEGFTVNVPVPSGTGAEGWLECLERGVLPALRAFDPHAILVSAGFDAHVKDPLGGLRLTSQTFHAAVQRCRDVTGDCVAAVLEGGYNMDALRDCAKATAAGLVGDAESPVVEEEVHGVRPWESIAPRMRRVHGARWGIG